MLHKFRWAIFFLLVFNSLAYGFVIDDFNLDNTATLYSNNKGSPYRLDYTGVWRYKKAFFLKTIYRADYSSNFHDTSFSQLIPDFGVYIYKNIALRYQYEEKRFHTTKKIFTTEESRVGFSIEPTLKLFNKKLLWINDIEIFPYESDTDQRIRWFTKLTYGKALLLNIFYIDIDHTRKDKSVDGAYFVQTTLGYSLYKNKYTDITLRFQAQKQKYKADVYRAGMAIEF